MMPKRHFSLVSSIVVLLFLALAQLLRAGSEEGTFELVGKLVPSDPNMLRNVYPTVSLNSVRAPFSTRTVADSKGQFKFKHLRAGMYTLTVFSPQVRVRRTVDIGPTFADAKGKIHLSVAIERQTPRRPRYTVSAAQLAIPESALSEYRKAQDYLEKGNSERATASLKKAVEMAPQFAWAWNTLGNIAHQSGQLEEAEVYFREALSQIPDFYRALISLGGTLIAQEKAKDSLAVFLRAVKLRPDDPEGQARLGLNYFQLGELDKAYEHLQEVKRIEPGHFSCPQIFLAQIYGHRGDRAAALLELEEFIKLHPDSDLAPSVRDSIRQLRVQ